MTTLNFQLIFAASVWLALVAFGWWAHSKRLLALTVVEFCIAASICLVLLLENTHSSLTISISQLVELGIYLNLVLGCVVGLAWSRKAYAEPVRPQLPKAPALGVALSVLRDQAPGQVRMVDSNEIVLSRPANRRGTIAQGQLVAVVNGEGPFCWVRPVTVLKHGQQP